MKKILALVLSMLIVIGMFAGCGKDEKTPTDNTDPSSSVENNEQTTTPTEDEEDVPIVTIPPDVEITIPEGNVPQNSKAKEEFWKNIFENNKYKFPSNSFEVRMNNQVFVKCLVDSNGYKYISISGTIDNRKTGVGLLNMGEEVYYHQFGDLLVGSDDSVWYQCVDVNNDNGNITIGEDNMESFEEAIGKIQKVEYVETNNNIDTIKIYYLSEETEDVVLKDRTFTFEYNGDVGEYRVTEYESGMISTRSTDTIDDFEWFDYKFDSDKMTLTKDDVVIQLKLKTDHLADSSNKDPDEMPFVEIDIDYKTYEIKKMSMTEEEMLSEIEFLQCDDVVAMVGPLDDSTQIYYERAMEQFAGTMMTLIFSLIPDA